MKKYRLLYDSPAESTVEGWEKYSLPIGNGYFGVSVFGGSESARYQFTTNEFACDYKFGGVSNFAELYLDFENGEIGDYRRELDLDRAVASEEYEADGNPIKREAFASYPDRVFALRVASKEPIDFDIRLEIPYLNARPAEEGGRTGEVTLKDGKLVMRGTLPFRDLIYEGQAAALSDGSVTALDGKLSVKGAKDTVVVFSMGTSYKLCPETFSLRKALGDDPHEAVEKRLLSALSLGWEKLLAHHEADHSALFSRAEIDLGGKPDERTTDKLLEAYRAGEKIPYLEELYFSYGRYLLIASSRKGSLPASLQGVWTVHDKSPWGSGFWHNINVQMNYWHAFSTNIAETFEAYADFFRAYLPEAKKNAGRRIASLYPERAADAGKCGWIIGTGSYAYEIEGQDSLGHSGPGTGGMTAKLFWDYYDFTRDRDVLTKDTFPAIHGMAEFLTKCVKNYGGTYLCPESASPEQIIGGKWIAGASAQAYYHTVGCAFDQQMIDENAHDDLEVCSLLDYEDDVTRAEKEQIGHYDPVSVGYSGQIKEYREEHFYGEIGEYKHRHISHLVGLMPGRSIGRNTPAWLDAAKITLDFRGDESTGWALAHRFCARARTGEGDRAYRLLGNLLKTRTHPNLWDVHPPFQIDGNFGATAGIAEMLLQSHEGYVTVFPALPDEWKDVSFRGLKARGNFTLDCYYENGSVSLCRIVSVVGGKFSLREEGAEKLKVSDGNGNPVKTVLDGDILSFDTEAGKCYEIKGFSPRAKRRKISVTACYEENGTRISFEGAACKIERAVGDAPYYTTLCENISGTFFDPEFSKSRPGRITYKVTGKDGQTGLAVLDPADEIERDRYKLIITQNNIK